MYSKDSKANENDGTGSVQPTNLDGWAKNWDRMKNEWPEVRNALWLAKLEFKGAKGFTRKIHKTVNFPVEVAEASHYIAGHLWYYSIVLNIVLAIALVLV